MKKTLFLIFFIISITNLFVSCEKESEKETTKEKEVLSVEKNLEDVNKNKEEEKKFNEAKNIVESYFEALSKNDLEEANKFWVEEFQAETISVKIDSIDVISVKNDENVRGFSSNRGSKIDYVESIHLLVKHSIQYAKGEEKKAAQDSGVYQRGITLVKKNVGSSWKIAEIGV